MEIRKHQIWNIQWVGSPAKVFTVPFGLQTGMGPGAMVLQEKDFLLLLPDSGRLDLQLS